jgi:hypothetical protein
MKQGLVYIKFVERKLPAGQGTQVMLLAGFNPQLVHATCTNYETMNPNHMLTQADVDNAIISLVEKNSAVDYTDVTAPGMSKKLARLCRVHNSPERNPTAGA